MRLNHERSFSKIAETAHRASSTEEAYSEHSIAIHSISMAGCVNAVRAIVCFELPAREAISFCDSWKLTSCDFIAFISSLVKVNFFIFRCAYNLCPNMNYFDAVDFSEYHSEEVISFFWGSVYIIGSCSPTSVHAFNTPPWPPRSSKNMAR